MRIKRVHSVPVFLLLLIPLTTQAQAKAIWGEVKDIQGGFPIASGLSFVAYNTKRPSEVLTQESPGSLYNQPTGQWVVEVDNFPTSWAIGDTVRVEFRYVAGTGKPLEVGFTRLVLDGSGNQAAPAIQLRAQSEVTPTSTWHDVYGIATVNGVAIWMDDVIRAYDPDGVLCGIYTAQDTTGRYGFMPIYGDDPDMEGDQGADPGDRITFTIQWTRDRTVYPVREFLESWDPMGQTRLDLTAKPDPHEPGSVPTLVFTWPASRSEMSTSLVLGYRIYGSQVLGQYTYGPDHAILTVPATGDSLYTALGVLAPDGEWYWVVTAYGDGIESIRHSPEAKTTILLPPDTLTVEVRY